MLYSPRDGYAALLAGQAAWLVRPGISGAPERAAPATRPVAAAGVVDAPFPVRVTYVQFFMRHLVR
jgi:hypothetical protein